VIRQIHCPACQSGLAYSAALLGRTIRCLTCHQPFPVITSPDGVNATAPPLPARGSSNTPLAARRPDEPAVRRSEEPEEYRGVDRSSGTLALIGLTILFSTAFLVITGGICYLLWPSAASNSSPATQTAAPPEQSVTGVEQPKSLNDLLKDSPQRQERPKQTDGR
jgi:hypothetical protein